MIKKQVYELRERIFNYKILDNYPTSDIKRLNSNKFPDHADIIIFGPSGAGKSSLIQTFYRALHECQKLPEKEEYALSIKDKDQNEGTTKFTAFTVKKRTRMMTVEEKKTFRLRPQQALCEEEDEALSKKGKKEEFTSAIVVHDTRGQIWMDNHE